MEFQREYPDDAACLDYLWRTRYSPDGETAHCPKCDRSRQFKRYETTTRRQSWTCTACGHHVHPTAGTIFHKSSTSLHLWFYAIYLMSSTKCGLAAKQLEREIGVNYKTAHRMLRLIRTELMAQDDDGPLSGEVEADETLVGGKMRNSERRKREALGWDKKRYDNEKKTMVFAAVERGGRVRAKLIPNSSGPTLSNAVHEFVMPGSILFTDEYVGYNTLGETRYVRRRIRHRDRVYVEGTTHTQTVEGFFGHFKTDVRGTHHSISRRWLQAYLNEWTWKWNHRRDDEAMFRTLLLSAASAAG
jgi:transposase-like protein